MLAIGMAVAGRLVRLLVETGMLYSTWCRTWTHDGMM